jgi:aminomethyltransferase
MLQTPLIEYHRSAGGRLVDFAGWEMPVVYTSIIDEHLYTRAHATFFDVSHMGRVEFSGPGAVALLERLSTRRIGDMAVGQCRYSHMCREDGGVLDDVIVSRLESGYLVVCNASNREKLLAWWKRQSAGQDVVIADRTFETGMVAIQGPEALETLDQLLPFRVSELKRYHFKTGEALGATYYAARSGYTGEDGIEIILPAPLTLPAVNLLLERSAEIGRPVRAAGLGARDTLRMEAGMPLYGHELSEEWDSITAGQAWCVDLSKDFIGREALQRVKERGPSRVMVGLELEGRRAARQGAAVQLDGRSVGVVTSGSHSPTFDKPLAMGFVEPRLAEPGTTVQVDLRGTPVVARVVKLPFYKRGQ